MVRYLDVNFNGRKISSGFWGWAMNIYDEFWRNQCITKPKFGQQTQNHAVCSYTIGKVFWNWYLWYKVLIYSEADLHNHCVVTQEIDTTVVIQLKAYFEFDSSFRVMGRLNVPTGQTSYEIQLLYYKYNIKYNID